LVSPGGGQAGMTVKRIFRNVLDQPCGLSKEVQTLYRLSPQSQRAQSFPITIT
jgi:hypothetical protein